MTTIDNIIDRFLYPAVTPIIGQPGYQFQTLKKLSDIFTASTTKVREIENSSKQNIGSNVCLRLPIPTNQSNRTSALRVHTTNQSKLPSYPRVYIILSEKTTPTPPRVETMHIDCTEGTSLIEPYKQDPAQNHLYS